ncbi:MAG: 3-keto-5-aminohexanoate cleavage protein [Actinomycetota bacterium]
MDPLIITATTSESWLWPAADREAGGEKVDVEALVAAGRRCRDAGAAVLHIHAGGVWKEAIEGIRAESDILIQCGMSTLSAQERVDVFRCKAEMISVMLSHHDEAFLNLDNHVLHPREELCDYAVLCREHGVKPEFEVWHSGSIWNLEFLLGKGLLDAPHITTLFLGWPGGSWSPPTVEEYLYRRAMLPEGCAPIVSVMGEHQREVHTVAVQRGDHIRVGTEDWPFDRKGERASSPKLVAEAVEMAEVLGRRVASVDEARRMLGL